MKKISIILLCMPLLAISQIKMPEILKATTEEILRYEQAIDIETASQYKDNTKFNTYITKDNVEINIGDELTIGTNSDAEKFKNIFEGNTKNRKLESCKNLESKYANTTVIVKSIYVTHQDYEGYKVGLWKNKKKTPLYIHLLVKPLGDGSMVSKVLMPQAISIFDLEKAFLDGEIINPNPPITKEEAIRQLKEAKDLMELDLLSEEEYNKLRKELLPIIKK